MMADGAGATHFQRANGTTLLQTSASHLYAITKSGWKRDRTVAQNSYPPKTSWIGPLLRPTMLRPRIQ